MKCDFYNKWNFISSILASSDLSSADNLWQFGPRSGLIWITLMVFLKVFFEKKIFWKISADHNKKCRLLSCDWHCKDRKLSGIEFCETAEPHTLALCLLVSSADNLCKQFGSRSGPTKCRAWSGSKLFDTLMIFLKEFFEKIDFEKSADDKKACGIIQ